VAAGTCEHGVPHCKICNPVDHRHKLKPRDSVKGKEAGLVF
jgi:hypothetical protein